MPAAAERGDAVGPAFRVVIDGRQDHDCVHRNAPALSRGQLTAGPIEELQIVGGREVDSGPQSAGRRFESRGQHQRVRPRLDNAFRDAGVCGSVEPIRHACPDRIQVDVGHGGEDRTVVAQSLAFVAAFPESSLATVFAIRSSRDRFDQTAHEPGKAAQTLAQDADSVRVCEQALALAFDRVVDILARWEQSDPARCDFVIVPCCRFVWGDAQYQMQMIAHDRVGVDGDSEAFGHELERASTHAFRCSKHCPV